MPVVDLLVTVCYECHLLNCLSFCRTSGIHAEIFWAGCLPQVDFFPPQETLSSSLPLSLKSSSISYSYSWEGSRVNSFFSSLILEGSSYFFLVTLEPIIISSCQV